MRDQEQPKALVLYHYFHPDDVVSAQHYADLCSGLARRGWQVTAMPCNRGCRNEHEEYCKQETWMGVDIRRIWRPRFRQASKVGRLLNSAWLLIAWSLQAFKHRPDVLIIGTDPIFSVLVALPWRILRPKTKLFHWCFDLHPEASIAEGALSPKHPLVRLLRWLLCKAYQSCHLLGSLGACMTSRLHAYAPNASYGIYTPWALVEPSSPLIIDNDERSSIFSQASLTLMYSGNFGKAHDADTILSLARLLRPEPSIQFAFCIRGNCANELMRTVTTEDTNIRFVDFAPQSRLEARLGCADIHMVSLRSDFTGIVVPSKFQGALAAGRPILFAGPEGSAVASWIREHNLGWVLTPENLHSVAKAMLEIARSPHQLTQLKEHCHSTYHRLFSCGAVIDALNDDLRAIINRHNNIQGQTATAT